MFSSSLHALVVFCLAACALAHSTRVTPLRRIAAPTTHSLQILPRNPHAITPSTALQARRQPHIPPSALRFSDSFRLVLAAYGDTFHLHLRPNDHLVHPAARISYYTTRPDGTDVLDRTVPLLRESVRAYMGDVVSAAHSPQRMREDTAGRVQAPHPADRGWARILVHGGGDDGTPPVFEGAFSADGIIYHVMTRDHYLRTRLDLDPLLSEPVDDSDPELVIWRESDAMTLQEAHEALTGNKAPEGLVAPQSCGHDRLEYNAPDQHPLLTRPRAPLRWTDVLLNDTLYRRDDVQTGNGGMGTNFVNSIGSTQGCPNTQRIIYMGVAADCTYVSTYGGQENATQQILNNWNSASALYKTTFNVSLGIAELQVKSETCPTVPDSTAPWNVPCSGTELDDRLSIFSKWRGDKGEDGMGLWHLMSGCPTGSEVGIAWLATLCQTSVGGKTGAFVSGTAVSTAGRTEWQVVAHEIGHNFGAIHDCADGCNSSSACCPLTASGTCSAAGRFIMSPVAQAGETIFSQCTIGNICSVMTGAEGSTKLDASCLVEPDPARQTISLQMCGNGIVEPGEDCDPGVGSTSPCCNAATCKFTRGAICDPQSSPCCTATCSFAPATQVCRPARDALCDTTEMCTGNSSSCPTDVVAKNGQGCGNGLACASGQCTSNSAQCKAVGASMGLTKACPSQNDKSCQISCQDPTNSGACIRLTSLLIDGSPCGLGGSCVSGKCQSAGFFEMVKAWVRQNLQIAIPVIIVGGLLVLVILWFFLRSIARCCGSRSRRPPVVPPLMPRMATHERLASYDPLAGAPASRSQYMPVPTAPAPAHDRSRSGDGSELRYNYAANNRMDWVDDGAYNGARRY